MNTRRTSIAWALIIAGLAFAAFGGVTRDPQSGQRFDDGQATTTLSACEDQNNTVCRVEQQFDYKNVPHADTQIKSAAGFLHTVTCSSDAAATAGALDIYDNPAATGTKIYTITFGTGFYPPATLTLDVVFTTGLYFDFTTTADVDCVVSYR